MTQVRQEARHANAASSSSSCAASLVIAALLGYVAVILGRDTKELLIGESADPVVRATAFATITSHPEITGVKEIFTMQLGPASVLVAARVQFEDDLNAQRIQLVCPNSPRSSGPQRGHDQRPASHPAKRTPDTRRRRPAERSRRGRRPPIAAQSLSPAHHLKRP